jgi:uncharacterized protein
MKRYCYALVPLLVLLLAISLACLLAYGIQQGFDTSWSLRKLIRKTTQVLLLLSVIPTMWLLKCSLRELGFAKRPLFFRQVSQGFALGLVTLIPVFIALYSLGVHVVDTSQPWTYHWVIKKLVVELLLALLVSFFEEPLFRGMLLAGLKRQLPVLPAIAITAFYYAILHFLDSKTAIPTQATTWYSGFQLLAHAIANLFNPSIGWAFSSLFLVGLFLGWLRQKQATYLGICIGCHAAWVWQIKLNKTFFNTDYHSNWAYLVSHYDGVVGPLVTVWLLIALAVGIKIRGNQSKAKGWRYKA